MISSRQLFLNHLAQTSDTPLMVEVEYAEGIYFYSPEGKRYTDLISGIAVSSLGHRHPKVVQAVKDQVDKYMHLMVYGELLQSPQNKLAQKLTSFLPENLNNVYLVNSGTEATEGAMKLAKRYTGRIEIIACRKSYHGSTQGALSLGEEEFKQAYRPLLPGINHIHYGSYSDVAQKITTQTAAVIIEPVQGEAGVIHACSEYFKALRQKCDETGTLLIFDEIQSGFGRTGKLWAFEHYGVVPDILLLAKSMGGGMPIGAFVSSKEIMQSFTHQPILGHITTFGGHPVSCAAALASLEVLTETKIYEEAEDKAMYFIKKLKHPKIKQIRHVGLMMAAEFESFEVLKQIIDRALDLGVLTDWFLYCDNSMRIAPPLIITYEQIDEVCELLIKAMDSPSTPKGGV
jgi:acetylornithine/succinyldiaminopimelate/putrescine aminotransferase